MYQLSGRCPELSQKAGGQGRPLTDVHDPLGISVPGHRGRACWSKRFLLDKEVSRPVGEKLRSIEIKNQIWLLLMDNESDGSRGVPLCVRMLFARFVFPYPCSELSISEKNWYFLACIVSLLFFPLP